MISMLEYGLLRYDNKFQMKPRCYVFPFDFFFSSSPYFHLHLFHFVIDKVTIRKYKYNNSLIIIDSQYFLIRICFYRRTEQPLINSSNLSTRTRFPNCGQSSIFPWDFFYVTTFILETSEHSRLTLARCYLVNHDSIILFKQSV